MLFRSADRLNALGVPTAMEIQKRQGLYKGEKTPKKGWLPPFVWHLLTDETYTGRRVYHANKTGEQIAVDVPPLISRDTFVRAREIMAEHSKKNWYKPQYKYLLTGLVRCGVCGKIYSGRTVKRWRYGSGELYLERSYCCGSKRHHGDKSCGNKNVNADKLEAAVWDIIVNFISNPGPVFERIVRQVGQLKPDALQDEEKRLLALLADKENEKHRVMSLYRKGLANLEEIGKQVEETEKEKRILQDRLAEIRGQLEDMRCMQFRVGEAMDLVLRLGEQIKKPLPFERKRQIVKAFIKEVIVLPGGKPRKPDVNIVTYFSPDDPGSNELPTQKPLTDQARRFLSSSGVKNGPFFSRYWIILSAYAGPIPGRDSSSALLAVLIFIRLPAGGAKGLLRPVEPAGLGALPPEPPVSPALAPGNVLCRKGTGTF